MRRYRDSIIVLGIWMCLTIMNGTTIHASEVSNGEEEEEERVVYDLPLSVDFQPTEYEVVYAQEKITTRELQISITGETPESFVYLHQNAKSDWSDYNAFGLYVENDSEKEICLTFHIQVEGGENVNLANGTIVLLRENTAVFEEHSEEVELEPYQGVAVQDNFIYIEAGFQGELIIPFYGIQNKEVGSELLDQYRELFSSLFDEEINNSILDKESLEKIESWGITVIPNGSEEQVFYIRELALLHKENHDYLTALQKYKTQGESILHIPNMGEAIGRYHIEGAVGETYYLQTEDGNLVEGVTISNEGLLTVTPDAKEQMIYVYSLLEQGFILEQMVMLDLQWMEYELDDEGNPYYLLPPMQEDSFQSARSLLRFSDFVMVISIVLHLSAVVVLILYHVVRWNKRRRG